MGSIWMTRAPPSDKQLARPLVAAIGKLDHREAFVNPAHALLLCPGISEDALRSTGLEIPFASPVLLYVETTTRATLVSL